MSRQLYDRFKDSLTPEQLEKYRQQGEDFFSNFDFKDGKMITPLDTSARHILSAVKSGLPVDELDENEVDILKNVYGDNWKDKIFEGK